MKRRASLAFGYQSQLLLMQTDCFTKMLSFLQCDNEFFEIILTTCRPFYNKRVSLAKVFHFKVKCIRRLSLLANLKPHFIEYCGKLINSISIPPSVRELKTDVYCDMSHLNNLVELDTIFQKDQGMTQSPPNLLKLTVRGEPTFLHSTSIEVIHFTKDYNEPLVVDVYDCPNVKEMMVDSFYVPSIMNSDKIQILRWGKQYYEDFSHRMDFDTFRTILQEEVDVIVNHFSNVEVLQIGFVGDSGMEKISSNMKNLRELHFCSAIFQSKYYNKLTHLLDLPHLAKLRFDTFIFEGKGLSSSLNDLIKKPTFQQCIFGIQCCPLKKPIMQIPKITMFPYVKDCEFCGNKLNI